MIPQEIIRKKRDKKVLSKEEISLFVKGLTDGSFSDSQVAGDEHGNFFKWYDP
jgi:thymidine phosphorylase